MAADSAKTDEAPVNPFDPDVIACPHAAYKQLREHEQGVSRMPGVGVPIISRYEDVLWALRQPEIFSSAMAEEMQLGTERPMIPQQIDPPAQTRYRKLLDPLFSRKRSLQLEPEVRRQANALIDGFIDDGACDFNRAFAIPLPCAVFLSLLGTYKNNLQVFCDNLLPLLQALEKNIGDEFQTKSRIKEILTQMGEIITSPNAIKFLTEVAIACNLTF